MKFRTEIIPDQLGDVINYSKNIQLFGSCFTENIGSRLELSRFKTSINPFGVVFNPIAIQNLFLRAINNKHFAESDFFELNGKWSCFETHSRCSRNALEETVDLHNSILLSFREFVLETDVLILSWGTAYGYYLNSSGNIVANCHKVPQNAFTKKLVSVDEIVTSTEQLIESLESNVKVIVTVSPVRHWKDGAVNNTRSKARLIEAAHILQDKGLAHYFPSYELLMDDLRDYRFYGNDLLHPSSEAIEYIWEKFQQSTMTKSTRDLIVEVDKINKRLNHRFEDKKARTEMILSVKARIEQIQTKEPNISFNEI